MRSTSRQTLAQPSVLDRLFDDRPEETVDSSSMKIRIDVGPPVISNILSRFVPVGAAFLLPLLEATGLHIRNLYRLTQREATH